MEFWPLKTLSEVSGYIILLSKLAKKDKNEEIWGIVYVK
jgi:hypothetical protein